MTTTTTELAAGDEPEIQIPPATPERLIEVLASVFIEESAWEKAGTESLAYLVAARDLRFRHHDGARTPGRWAKSTLEQQVKNVRPEAKELAEYRRQNNF